jgi:hypothetical protein
VSFDVLEEAQSGLKKLNAACDVGPKMSWVAGSKALTCCAKWLTRVAASEEVHAARKL